MSCAFDVKALNSIRRDLIPWADQYRLYEEEMASPRSMMGLNEHRKPLRSTETPEGFCVKRDYTLKLTDLSPCSLFGNL